MPYGPHTPADRTRMLAAIGVDSIDELFADIPVALRASRPRPSGARARAQPRGAPPGAGGTQPGRPRLVPRGRRLPPLQPRRHRPDPPARRVVHGLHAVPARDQPGHPPVDLRVRVADGRAARARRRLGVALRRRRGDRRGRAHDLPGDPSRARPRLAGGPPPLPRDDRHLLPRRRPGGRRDPARRRRTRRRDDRSRGARAAAGRSRPSRRRGDRRPAQLPRPARADGRDRPARATPPERSSSPSSSPSRWPSSPRPASTGPTSPPARASRSGSRPSTAVRTSGSSPRPTPSSARSRAGSSG